MEHNDSKMNRSEKIQVVFLIMMGLTIGAILLATTSLIKYAEEIRQDPVDYAISKEVYNSCSCIAGGGRVVDFGEPPAFIQAPVCTIKVGERLDKEK